MQTYQDFLAEVEREDLSTAILAAIKDHKQGDLYQTALLADEYDHQKNTTINQYVQTLFNLTGERVEDFTASNAKLASNFFARLNTQRCTYSLGNGVTFTNHIRKEVNKEGLEISTDETKERLGQKFDTDLRTAGYYALIHGVSYGFPDKDRKGNDRLKIFKATELAPLQDEETSQLRACIRFWQTGPKKPLYAVLYEEDGYTKYRTKKDDPSTLEEIRPKRAYKVTVEQAPADAEETVVDEENYGALPIVPLWGSRLHQSTLVGMRQKIDAFDLIDSGFANDLTDVAQIYTIIENCAGMSDQEMARVRDRMKTLHVIAADTSDGAKIRTETHEPPYEARRARLDSLRTGIYEDFGGLDVHQVSADSTNDHLEAAYQPLDENADDYEFQLIEFIQEILELLGIEDTPIFKRNKISNQKEQVEMLVMLQDHLDEETILRHIPFVSPDEVAQIIARKDAEGESRFTPEEPEDEEVEGDTE